VRADQNAGDSCKPGQTTQRTDPADVVGREIVNDPRGKEQERRHQATPGANLDLKAGALPKGRKPHAALGLPGHRWFLSVRARICPRDLGRPMGRGSKPRHAKTRGDRLVVLAHPSPPARVRPSIAGVARQ